MFFCSTSLVGSSRVSWCGTGYMQSMSWGGTGYMQSMSCGGTGYMQSMSWGGTGYMQSTSTSSEYSSLMISFLWICKSDSLCFSHRVGGDVSFLELNDCGRIMPVGFSRLLVTRKHVLWSIDDNTDSY